MKVCPGCGYPNLDNAEHCFKCMTSLSQQSVSQDQAAPPEPAYTANIVTTNKITLNHVYRTLGPPATIALGCIGLFALLFVVLLIFGLVSSQLPGNEERDAVYAARDFVRQNLKSPSTADFPAYIEGDIATYAIIKEEDGSYIIASYVDSQNSFGATVRTKWGCQVKKESNVWTLVDITFDEW